ncbi:hypothetical protein [Neisseria shayeganii]|uniref:Uncharacterized protein n=1 Tax=Neisseria shayeganii TaxID=607712 RepID=A0A7D7SJD4_9NEIS|nr:hypothetical protein [Neisseria shayeganii]QMT41387.1 hypothetical protein H3L94_05010 [Neisseria shayeganii]
MKTPETVTIPRGLACQIADSLLALGYFASHMQTMAEAGQVLAGSHPSQTARLLCTMGELAENAFESNGIGLSAELCQIMADSAETKEVKA